MPKISPEEAASKWSRRLQGATEDIRAGIERVTESPGVAAARKRQKWEAGIQASRDKWERNTRNVTLEDWKSKAIEVGVPRVAAGAAANEDKMAKFAAEFYPHLERGQQQVRQMPDTTPEDRINRAVAMMRHNAKFRRGGSS